MKAHFIGRDSVLTTEVSSMKSTVVSRLLMNSCADEPSRLLTKAEDVGGPCSISITMPPDRAVISRPRSEIKQTASRRRMTGAGLMRASTER